MTIYSLKNQPEFDLVNKQGKKAYSPYFILVQSKNFPIPPLDLTNLVFLGMKVGRKIGKAVVRNKIKRRIRHLVQIISKHPKLQPRRIGIIVIPKKGFEKIDFTILLSEFERILLE